MTAEKLAQELETSVRTVYRDMEALSTAGVPVYTERGPGGGCSLLESYRTNLAGLTEDETLALFMLSIPGPLADLGLSRQLRGAMQKLAASLPGSRRGVDERARQLVHLDWQGWRQPHAPAPHIKIIQQAVWNEQRLCLTCRLPFETQADHIVEPYGLVASGGDWYLVGARLRQSDVSQEQVRVYRVSRLLQAKILDQSFTRPAEFDLAQFWETWRRQVEEHRPRYPVRLRLAPALLPHLPEIFGGASREEIAAAPPDETGWRTLELVFESLAEARTRLLGLGRAAEVLQPPELRLSICDYAEQIAAFYRR